MDSKRISPDATATTTAVSDPNVGRRGRVRINKRESLAYALLSPGLIVICAVLFVPFVFNVYSSTQQWVLFQDTRHFIGFRNYRTLLQDPTNMNVLLRTVLYVILGVAVEFLLGVSVAVLLDEHFSNLGIATVVFLLPMVISSVAASLSWKLILAGQFSLINWFIGLFHIPPQLWLGPGLAFVSVLLVEIWQETPFVILLVFAALKTVPQDIVDAGELDGASGLAVLRHIVFPYIQPTILVVLMLRTIFALRAFGNVWALTEGGPADRTNIVGVQIYRQAFSQYDLGMAGAISTVLTIVSGLIAIVYIRALSRESVS